MVLDFTCLNYNEIAETNITISQIQLKKVLKIFNIFLKRYNINNIDKLYNVRMQIFDLRA